MGYLEELAVVKQLNHAYRCYKSITSLFELDQWSALPPEGATYRQQVSAFVEAQKNALFGTPEAQEAFTYFSGSDLQAMDSDLERGLVRLFLFRYRNAVRMPGRTLEQYNLLRITLMQKWQEARKQKDYRIFRPWLEQAFQLKKQIALAIEPDRPAFDTLVGMTDEGLSCQEVSEQFIVLKQGIRELLKKLPAAPQEDSRDSLLDAQEDPDLMEKFAHQLAYESGYDPQKGHFNDQVVHGFTSFMGPRDARISTYRNGSIALIFTCMHEAGHAMYATGGNAEVNQADLWGGIEGGFHEAMSRFNENMVARSRGYWKHYYPLLQQVFPRYQEVAEETFYRAINRVKPSPRRISADEVTYSLHAILRFELERDVFAGKIKAEELRDAWNEGYRTWLGVEPANDTEGILQDMHWAGDYIGYFQSYALGNIYDGQILERLEQDLPDYEKDLSQGIFARLNQWLDGHIRQYGCMFTGTEMLERLTGKSLDARPFLRYLEKKYLPDGKE